MPDPSIVFVTGGSGFVGRHVVQLLRERAYKVRALARRPPAQELDPGVELVIGDLTEPATYAHALKGASAVVHSALTERPPDDVAATSTLQKSSAQAGVRKFIHLSSVAVYGNPQEGTITEKTPPVPAADEYSRAKLAIEEAIRANQEVGEVTVLRLGCVYGPGDGWWSRGQLERMKRGSVILVDGGTGTANLVHAADVASMVLLLIERSNPPFDVFNVTDGTPVSWSRYFSELEGILGHRATVSMRAADARIFGRKWLHPSLMRRIAHKLLQGPVIHPLDDAGIDGFLSRAIYSSEKAVSELGFRPRYDLKSGIETMRLDWQAK
jgi:nucleoside-diphosphate-sugar epimerase